MAPGDTPATSTAAAAESSQEAYLKPEWVQRYAFPAGTSITVQHWHEAVPTIIEGELVKLWVFQPTGICDPIKLTINREGASFAAEFSALTVDIVKETSTF